MSLGTTGKLVIKKTVNDSDIGDWGVFGDTNQLVQAQVEVLADETSPKSLNIKLSINDGYGEQCFNVIQTLKMNYRHGENSEILSAKGKQDFYFLLPKRASYNVYLEIEPDQPVEKTWLSVKQGVKTLDNVTINQIIHSEI